MNLNPSNNAEIATDTTEPVEEVKVNPAMPGSIVSEALTKLGKEQPKTEESKVDEPAKEEPKVPEVPDEPKPSEVEQKLQAEIAEKDKLLGEAQEKVSFYDDLAAMMDKHPLEAALDLLDLFGVKGVGFYFTEGENKGKAVPLRIQEYSQSKNELAGTAERKAEETTKDRRLAELEEKDAATTFALTISKLTDEIVAKNLPDWNDELKNKFIQEFGKYADDNKDLLPTDVKLLDKWARQAVEFVGTKFIAANAKKAEPPKKKSVQPGSFKKTGTDGKRDTSTSPSAIASAALEKLGYGKT